MTDPTPSIQPLAPTQSPAPRLGSLFVYIARWLVLALLIAALAGSASALLIITLNWATTTRESHRWMIALLPLAGAVVSAAYKRHGPQLEAGNDLLIDEIHDPKKTIPFRLVPLILGGTIISHVFGASVGREGTAVQMGGALSDQLSRILSFARAERRVLLMAGISAGFASVFGTPLAGAVFGLEVLAIGRLQYDALFPCVVAAIAADAVTRLWGVHHTQDMVGVLAPLSMWTFAAMLIAGAIFGITGRLFAVAARRIASISKQRLGDTPLRPFFGGIIVAALVFAFHADRYIGLGIPTIDDAFLIRLPIYAFALKLLFTVISLGFGFKGGEVTPLFFIGAALGNALAAPLHLPRSLIAGVGFVAVFAGASNTPIASTLMAIELFGGDIALYALVACVCSYLFSGHAGIYHAQLVTQRKHSLN